MSICVIWLIFSPFTLKGHTEIQQQTKYEISDSLKLKICQETANMSEIRIANYCLDLTKNILTFSKQNDLLNGKANCIGYSIVYKSICEYAYKVNKKNVKIKHIRGYIYFSGINLCRIAQILSPNEYKNFVKDHDFVQIILENNNSFYIDPTLYDLINNKCMTNN